MAGTDQFEYSDNLLGEEDEETLAAIDQGIADADAGNLVPAERVRELMKQWLTESSILPKR